MQLKIEVLRHAVEYPIDQSELLRFILLKVYATSEELRMGERV